ncbi:MAG: hypothetical protein NT085_01955 [candidate division SR1 bacterium]|nr:hypothetical protein [candidate division SR1 bacterium]
MAVFLAQDLQINLADAPKEEIIATPENKESELNLDLDLNVSDAPKDDDRLKTEDQKNNEVVSETVAEPIVEPMAEPVAEPIVEPIVETPASEIVGETPVEQKIEETVVPEPIVETKIVETPVIEPVITEPIEDTTTPATTIELEPITATDAKDLKDDMTMINELEGHASAGGLAPEAIVAPQSSPVETAKTFDLDAMLGTPVAAVPQTLEQKAEILPMPSVIATPMETPAFTIPITTTTQIPVQAIMQTSISKNKSVKTLLFTVMFAALGFTTFFILKTMYPIEFGNMFGGQTTMHASEIATGTELTGTETTGTELTGTITTEEISGTLDTGAGIHESATGDNTFGALNDLTTTPPPVKDDISRLTEYVTQGNDFLTQGKTMNNNTVIKYGLYISKKATTFLEDIANGKEINNLSGYFAQFDQYIGQLKVLVGETPPTDTISTTPEIPVSPTPVANDVQMTPDSTTTSQ